MCKMSLIIVTQVRTELCGRYEREYDRKQASIPHLTETETVGGYGSGVEYLPSMCEALNLIASTAVPVPLKYEKI